MSKRLGELLVESGAVSAADLEEALALQSGGEPDRIGEILLARGKVSPNALALALAYQSGLPFIELTPVPPEVSDLVPLDLQVQNRLTPFELERTGGSLTLHLAIADPSSVGVIEDLSMQIGMAIKVYVASADQIEAAHAAYQGLDPIVWPHPSPGLPTAAAPPPAPDPVAQRPPAVPKVKVPSAPTKLPRGPRSPTHALPPPQLAAPPTERSSSQLAALPTDIHPEPAANPLASMALPDWLKEPSANTDGSEARPPDRALQLKLETLLAHGRLSSPESALATVVALLIRRGLLREHEVLDALGRK